MDRLGASRYLCRSCSCALRRTPLRSALASRRPLQSRPFGTAQVATTSHSPALPQARLPLSHNLQRPARAQRLFSAAARRDLQAVLNPRHDEDGNEMSVDITPRAANRLSQIAAKEDNPDVALRVTVESGGCHGFQYLMSLIKMSDVDEAEDTVFEGDKGARVVMDEPSLDLLKGSKVDYTMELIGSQFKITDNPLATSSCGCGTSFDIKAA